MSALIRLICCVLLAAMLSQPALAQRAGAGGGGGQRVQGGGINYAPQGGVYSVISIDADDRTVQLRAADGRTGVVHVSEQVYDLSKLKPGDKIKVDFVVPDETNKKLVAASIWPAQ